MINKVHFSPTYHDYMSLYVSIKCQKTNTTILFCQRRCLQIACFIKQKDHNPKYLICNYTKNRKSSEYLHLSNKNKQMIVSFAWWKIN